MANLDDFFAKKDKKKKGKKFVTANTDVLATKLEENARKEHEAELKAASIANYSGTEPVSIDTSAEGRDDEWMEYQDTKKDYSGLKIETLKIDPDSLSNDEDGGDYNEDGERIRTKKTDGGPWNKLVAGQKTEEQDRSEASTPEPAPVTEPPPSGQKSAYVPPHLRGGSASTVSVSSGGPKSSKRNKAAPDISNELYFPSLSASVTDPTGKQADRNRDSQFERVRSGGSNQNLKSSEGLKLALDNKYAALRGE